MSHLPGVLIALALAVPAVAGQGDARLLAPTGTLRASLLATNPVQGRVDPQTGAVTGPVADLVRVLAAQLAVPYTLVPVANAAAVIESIRTGQVDIGFLAYEAVRAEQVDFSAPYFLMGNAYIVRADSPLQRAAAVDRAGVRVRAVKGQSQQIWVSEHLTRARIDTVPDMPGHAALAAMLARGEVDVFAANRQRLEEAVQAAPGMRVLADNFSVVGQAIVVPKGDAARLARVNAFVAAALESGEVRAALDRAKLAGVEVAPSPRR